MGAARVFVKGMSSEQYGLREFRGRQRAAPRVRSASDDFVLTGQDPGYSEGASAQWRLAPGDDPFLTQTLQVHLVEVPARGENKGHGHQNEAAFYILDGAGYEIHDGKRYDWSKDDLVMVHNDSVHQHFNPYDEPAMTIVFKAKATYMFLGLLQQGRSGPLEAPELYGERQDWSHVWTPGVHERRKVVSAADTHWEDTPLGRVRVLTSPSARDIRCFSVDVFELEVAAGASSGRYWKMADEILHVVRGNGYSLHWTVEAELDDKYYARIATTPERYDFSEGDTLYVPQNTVAQHFAADGSPLRLLSAQNRIFKTLGYDNVHFLEPA